MVIRRVVEGEAKPERKQLPADCGEMGMKMEEYK